MFSKISQISTRGSKDNHRGNWQYPDKRILILNIRPGTYLLCLGLTFYEGISFTGGEDDEYFLRASDMGAKIIRTNNAIVKEIIPPERLYYHAQIKRAMGLGCSITLVEITRCGRVVALIKLLPKALRRLCKGALKFMLSPFLFWHPWLFRHALLKVGKSIASAIGIFRKLIGYNYEVYRRYVVTLATIPCAAANIAQLAATDDSRTAQMRK